jgi:hypothetical protein
MRVFISFLYVWAGIGSATVGSTTSVSPRFGIYRAGSTDNLESVIEISDEGRLFLQFEGWWYGVTRTAGHYEVLDESKLAVWLSPASLSEHEAIHFVASAMGIAMVEGYFEIIYSRDVGGLRAGRLVYMIDV